MPAPMGGQQKFSTGLCDCCDGCGTCCLGCWCPCVLYGQNSQLITGDFLAPCLLYAICPECACFFANETRRALREKYNLEEAPCSDCCVHCLASPCALCQEAREISRRAGAPTGAGTPAYYPTTHQPPPAVAMTAQPYPPAHYPPSMPPSAPAAPSPGGYYPSVPNAPPVQYGAMYGGRM